MTDPAAAAVTTACSRKKRSIIDSPIQDLDLETEKIIPSSSVRKELRENERDDKSIKLNDLEELNQVKLN